MVRASNTAARDATSISILICVCALADAKRLRLKRVLNSIEPIEFVLPQGGLSSYSERVIEDFTRGQRNREGNAVASAYGGHGQPSTSVIRIERLADSVFDVGEDISARVQVPDIPWLSRLHPLCMRCFCGVHSFLSALSLERTLVSPRYTDVRHVVDSSISQFCLPPETQRDLDLFVNSVCATLRIHHIGAKNYCLASI